MSAESEQLQPPNEPSAFESLCRHVFREIWADPGALKNGRKGQGQKGVDIYGQHQGRWIGVQCKLKDARLGSSLTRSEVDQEVQKALAFEPKLGIFIVATSSPRDAKIQEHARRLTVDHQSRNLFEVVVWAWEDIWQEIYQREELLRRIKSEYWPRIAGAETTIIAAPSRLFRGSNKGTDSLVGRDEELAQLDAVWSAGEERPPLGAAIPADQWKQQRQNRPRVITLVAWAGVGKTSLVAHWAAKQLAQPENGGIRFYFDWSFYIQGARREGDVTGAAQAASADLFIEEALKFFGDPSLAESNVGAQQKGERLAELIGKHRTLLILDGVEPLQDARTGELRDDGLRALLRGLVVQNEGLCLVTTRQRLSDLTLWRQTTAPEWELASLTREAGSSLLTKLGVIGTDSEKCGLSECVKGHALTLTLLGSYLKRAHHGDIRRVDRVDFEKVNEKEQGGHAFRVIAAYERWFEENNCLAELSILRILGLFDRPATVDCLGALRAPAIPGLTDVLAALEEDDWNDAVSSLIDLNLVEEQPWEPRPISGYGDGEASLAQQGCRLGDPTPFPIPQAIFGMRHSLDAHPLIREYFADVLRKQAPEVFKVAHSRLFRHLCKTVPHWPEGLLGLQSLYQAMSHGCHAGLHSLALDEVYIRRILRHINGADAFYSIRKIGAIGTDLGIMSCLFEKCWTVASSNLSIPQRSWLLDQAALRLRAAGRHKEALDPQKNACELASELEDWPEAATRVCNLSELHLTLGDLTAAVAAAEKAKEIADRLDFRLQVRTRVALGDALDQIGNRPAARGEFQDAEKIQIRYGADFPFRYSTGGFRFVHFIFAEVERMAWRNLLGIHHDPIADYLLDQDCPELVFESFTEPFPRFADDLAKALKFAKANGFSLISNAFLRLAFGRVLLFRSILESKKAEQKRFLEAASHELTKAIEGIWQAGHLDYLPAGLISRAWLRHLEHDYPGAQTDLDQAREIADRGPLPLFLADIRLTEARLFRKRNALAEARDLINYHSYLRRSSELKDAEAAALNWPS